MAVEPGHAASFALAVPAGAGGDVRFELDGAAAAWAVVAPPVVSVSAGGTARARVVVQVPRSPRVAPGPVPLVVRPVGAGAGGPAAELRATVDVTPFADVRASLSPRTSRGRRRGRHTLYVENLGNQAVGVTVEPDAGAAGLRVDVEETSLRLAPGEAAAVGVGVEARGRRLVGRPRARSFAVAVRGADVDASSDGFLVQDRVRWPLPVALALAAAGLAALAAAGGGRGGEDRVPVVARAAPATAAAQTASCPPDAPPGGAVVVQHFLFCPATVSVTAGSELQWTNRDQVAHTVTADGGEFDTGNFGRDDVRTVRFDRPGTFSYVCRLHPFMRGTVVVTSVP